MNEWIAAGVKQSAQPRVTLNGRGEVLVEGHTGLFSYDTARVRIRTPLGILEIRGQDLVIGYFGAEDLMVRGRVDGVGIEGE